MTTYSNLLFAWRVGRKRCVWDEGGRAWKALKRLKDLEWDINSKYLLYPRTGKAKGVTVLPWGKYPEFDSMNSRVIDDRRSKIFIKYTSPRKKKVRLKNKI